MKRVLMIASPKFLSCDFQCILKRCGFITAGEAETEAGAVELYKELKPDIVVIGLDASGLDGTKAIHLIKDIDENAQIIVFCCPSQRALIPQAIKAGVLSFIIMPSVG